MLHPLLLAVATSVLFSISPASLAQHAPSTSSPVAQPVAHIDLAFLGYAQPSRNERLIGDEPSVSLDFVDSTHLLFTFDRRKLFARLPECPRSHQDRMIHAAILETPGGKVVREADWYLHDRRRYLWPLGGGRFLLRKLNSLYLVDSNLQEQLLLDSPRDLAWLSVSADGKQVILETRIAGNDIKQSANDAATSGKTNTKFALDFFDIDSRTPKQTIGIDKIVHVNTSGNGYADVLRKGDLWLVRFGPTPAQRKNVARIRSRCTPDVFYSASNSMLIGRCSTNLSDYSVTAFSLTGRRLWRQHWKAKRFSPAVLHSDDNRRFAVSSFSVPDSLPSAPATSDDETDPEIGLQQNIEILETASGDPVQSLVVTPSMVSAQNFSLSPDGMSVAALHNSQIELYDLPKISDEEQAKFSALQADVPGLYIVPKSDSESAEPSDIADDAPHKTPTPDFTLPSNAAVVQGTFSQTNSSPAAVAVNKQVPAHPVPTFRASVQAVTVDVVVADSKNHPIKGLRQPDFQLEEDGKPQNLHYFHEFDPARAAPENSPAPKPSPNVFTNITTAPDTGSVVLILLDLLNTPTADQQFAQKQLIKFLKTKPQHVQFALCTLSPNQKQHLRLIQGFTPDENLLLAAANSNKATSPTMSFQSAIESQNAVNAMTQLAQSDTNSHWESLLSGLQTIQQYEKESDASERAGLTVDALSQLARYLSGIPGRKNIVWLSGSFPVSFSPNPSIDTPSIESHSYSTQVRHAANLLARAQVTVYPVDVRGLVGTSLAADSGIVSLAPASTQTALTVAPGHTARDGTLAGVGSNLVVSPQETFQDQTMQELSVRSAEMEAMNDLARGTGGKAFFNSNAIEDAIATAVEQGSNYYTLSYTPTNRNYDGKFRKIKVALAAKGYHLYYRPGYFADDPHAPIKNPVGRNGSLVAMQHGSPQSRQILFAARVVPVGQKKKIDNLLAVATPTRKKPAPPATVEVQHYTINFAVDSANLRFVEQDNGDQNSSLTVMLAAYDSEGRQLAGLSSQWAANLKPAAYKDVLAGGIRLEQQLDIPLQAVSLRLGVADQSTYYLGTLEVPLPVPVPTDLPLIVKHSLPEIEPD
jgi:VWFA-related protein